MAWAITKVLLSALIISAASTLAGKKPALAGFLMALPLASMLALAFSYAEFRDAEKAAVFARSILAAVPLSLLFFVPFLLAPWLNWGFWWLFAAGIGLLVLGYGAHSLLFA